MVDDLVALETVNLGVAGVEAYYGLRDISYHQNLSLNIPSLRTAKFHVFNADSVTDVTYFAQFHAQVQRVEVFWTIDDLSPEETCDVFRRFTHALSRGQEWVEVASCHFMLER